MKKISKKTFPFPHKFIIDSKFISLSYYDINNYNYILRARQNFYRTLKRYDMLDKRYNISFSAIGVDEAKKYGE